MTSWLFPDMHRPQYPPTPDVLQSALAWSFFNPVASTEKGKKRGFVYFRPSAWQPKRVEIVSTRPERGECLAALIAALRDEHLSYDGGAVDAEVASAIADSLVGIESLKSSGVTAAPICLASALLQDPRGAMGVGNPPNFAALINQMYFLGTASRNGTVVDTRLASQLWLHAVTTITKRAGLLQAIDAGLYRASIKPILADTDIIEWPTRDRLPLPQSIAGEAPEWWTGDNFDPSDTPFGWFAEAWRKLCSDEWIKALPPRRWADWASCVLRQALAFCFLWEANFFRELGTHVVMERSDSPDARAARMQSAPMGLIPWATGGSISSLDVKPRIRELLRAGHACRAAFMEWQKNVAAPREKDLVGMLNHARKKAPKKLREQLREALDGSRRAGGLANLVETVEYSLLCRRAMGRSADFYGFTNTVSRRFTHVAPSPEWIVVISSVASRGPRESCRLADVLHALRRLGLQPRIDTLVHELERAGLCASAPDGDEGILVAPAFGG